MRTVRRIGFSTATVVGSAVMTTEKTPTPPLKRIGLPASGGRKSDCADRARNSTTETISSRQVLGQERPLGRGELLSPGQVAGLVLAVQAHRAAKLAFLEGGADLG